MIEFKIKTLDGKDHNFSVDDEITVHQLKLKVLEQMGVEIELQRLIFCGRVLQDDKRLAEYDVNKKVVHMVQKPPPGLESQQSGSRDREPERDNLFLGPQLGHSSSITAEPLMITDFTNATNQQIRRLMSLAANAQGIEIEEQPGSNLSPSASRMEFLSRLITEIRTNLDALRRSESNEPHIITTEDPLAAERDPPFSSVPVEVMFTMNQDLLLYQVITHHGCLDKIG